MSRLMLVDLRFVKYTHLAAVTPCAHYKPFTQTLSVLWITKTNGTIWAAATSWKKKGSTCGYHQIPWKLFPQLLTQTFILHVTHSFSWELVAEWGVCGTPKVLVWGKTAPNHSLRRYTWRNQQKNLSFLEEKMQLTRIMAKHKGLASVTTRVADKFWVTFMYPWSSYQ